MKMTFQPKKKTEIQSSWFQSQNEHSRRKKSVSCKKSKRKSKIIRLIGSERPQVIVAFLIIYKETNAGGDFP